MKNTLYPTLFVLIVGALGYFGLPWWWLVAVAAVAGLLFPISAGKGFAVGTAMGTLLWYSMAMLLNMANGGALAGKVSQIFLGYPPLVITSLLGGLLGGFGMLTGCLARELFKK